MAQDKYPVTPAIRVLRQHKIDFSHHPYEYEERGGTAVSALWHPQSNAGIC